jgi:hypothetical protein
MAPDELVGDAPRDGVKVKGAAFAAELTVKDDLEQEVAQFLDHLLFVARLDGIEKFVYLFDGVVSERVVVLFAVPGAA